MKPKKQKQKPIYETAVCPHCGSESRVCENGRYACPRCKGPFDVDWFHVPGVRQPDEDSCGWATTKWLLQSFGALDVDDRELREELNTDAKRGVRAWWNATVARFAERKFGKDWEAGAGTLPWAIVAALRRRGIAPKNPIRAESPLAYTGYLNDTFRAGGRAALLLWRMDGVMHWMGVVREKGRIRVMDPSSGRYKSFRAGVATWDNFIVFGFVRR